VRPDKRIEDRSKRASIKLRKLRAARKETRQQSRKIRASHKEAAQQVRKLRAYRKQARQQIRALDESREQARQQIRALAAAGKKGRRLTKDTKTFRKRLRSLFGRSAVELTAAQQVALLYWLRKSDALTERDLHALLNSLFARREMKLVQSVVADETLGFDLVRSFYRLRLADYRSDPSTAHQAVEVFSQADRSFLRSRTLNLFLQRAVMAADKEAIDKVLSQTDDRDVRRISRMTLMGICRLLLTNSDHDGAVRLLTRYIRPDRVDQQLYFLEPLLELYDSGALTGELRDFCAQLQPVSSATVLERLSKAYQGVDDADRQNFQRYIVGPLSALTRNERNLMDVRFSAEQRVALRESIKRSVSEAKPLSLIRLGDGESYPYQAPQVEGINPAVFESDNSDHERHWWGGPPPAPIREDIMTRVRQAVAQCDILGVPSVYRIIRDLPNPRQRYGRNRSQRAFIKILSALGQAIPVDGKLLTEERCHRCALDGAFLIELAALARSVTIVSCWPDLHLQFRGESVTAIVIPPQYNLRDPASRESVPALFDCYPEIVERVRAASAPGTLLLVGAGIIGKILVDEARECGAAALDVGSLLDYIAGVKTRSVGDVI
jgi:hypothetical protein